MEKITIEIIKQVLIEVNGYSAKDAELAAPECKGHELYGSIDKILKSNFGEIVKFTTQMSKLDKGCAPSVSLMDTRIDIAKRAIDKMNK